jgi:MinD superfamily P-loop ATPase
MIIAVTSGKGGTGKTLVSTSIAKSIKNVQFLDCDVEEPNSCYLLNPEIKEVIPVMTFIPEINSEKCNFCKICQEKCRYNAIAVLKDKVMVFQELCHHCGACVYLCPQKAMVEKEMQLGIIEKGEADGIEFLAGKLDIGQPVAPPLIKELKKYIDRDKNVILDSSPGVACPVINTLYQSDFVIMVTEPTPFGFYDLKLTVEICENLNLKKGVIINRAGQGDEIIEDYCRENNIPVLLKIPFKREIAVGYSNSIPLCDVLPEYKDKLAEVHERIVSQRV